MGFPVPWDHWLRESYLPRIETMLLDSRVDARGWVRSEAIRELIDQHRRGTHNWSRQLWNLWGLEVWARVFFDGEAPAGEPEYAVQVMAGSDTPV